MNPFRDSTRKHKVYGAWLTGGEEAARALNTTLPEPVKENSLRSWFSSWRNGRLGTPQPRPPGETQAMEAFAERVTGATRTDRRAKLYLLPDGKTAKMRTSIDRVFMSKGEGAFRHPVDFILCVMPKVRRNLASGMETYLVPIHKAREAADASMAEWMANPAHAASPNDMTVIAFDRIDLGGGVTESGRDYATKWKQYRLPDIDQPAATEPVVRYVNSPRWRAFTDRGEVLSADDPEGFVLLMRNETHPFSGTTNSNAEFMQQVAQRAALFGRKAPRTDSALNFIFDMEREGVITLIKRELVLETATN
jgi:hypothetical protein